VNAGRPQQDAWLDGEKEFRKREVDTQERLEVVQRRAVRWQVAVAIAAVVASLTAVFVAYQARSAVLVAEQSTQLQDAENQLSTAITALGGTTAAQRVAGVTLLERNVADQLTVATNSQSRQNAYGLYTSAIIVLSNYLRSGMPTTTNTPCPYVSADIRYAADELKTLLDMQQQVMGLKEGIPALDLSRTELCSQYWHGIRFNWLETAYLWKIDLRGANLANSHWGKAYLADAKLQCADLRGSDLSHATLTGADLRGANLAGALLPKTLKPAQLVDAVRVARAGWDPGRCLGNKAYWGPLNAPATATNVRSH